MSRDAGIRSAMARRELARQGGIWEILGLLAAVIPCGILAGLYLATEETGFIVACLALAALAVAFIVMRRPPLRLPRRRRAAAGGERMSLARGIKASERLKVAADALGRTFTRPILKILGFALWIVAWGVTAALYARIVDNAQIGGLVILVVVGGFSPLLIYFGLESGISKLTGRMGDRE